MAYTRKNFSYSTVLTAPSPAASGTSVVLQAGDGANFAANHPATIWPVGVLPTATNAEIVLVTAVATDTLTITRTQESTSARTVVVGDQIAQTISAKTMRQNELYEAVVDAAGNGDYTLISAAIAAGKTRIFVRNGAYAETTGFSASTANTTIVGESPEGVVITVTAGQVCNAAGNYQLWQNLKFIGGASATYALQVDGDNVIFDKVHTTNATTTARILKVQGNYFTANQCNIEVTANANATAVTISNSFSAVQPRFVNCRFRFNSGNGSTGMILNQIPDCLFSGCTFDVSNGNSGAQTLLQLLEKTTIVGCTLRTNQVTGQQAITMSNGSTYTIVGNNFQGWATTIVDTTIGSDIYGNTGLDITLEKRHMYMKNTSGATIAAGAVVTWKAVAAGNEITTTTNASDNLVMGVMTASCLNNAFGYVQIKGKTTLLKADGTTDIAVGDLLTTFTTAEIVAKAAAGNLAIAIALEAYTTNDSLGVLDALIIEPRRL